MKRFLFIIIPALLLAFSSSNLFLDLPEKQVRKAITKNLQIDEFELLQVESSCFIRGQHYKIHTDNGIAGSVYVGRTPTCVMTGCYNYEQNNLDLNSIKDFEYFDFYAIIDAQQTVQFVSVFDYRATYGIEVSGKGWLKQFIGSTKSSPLDYGKDIDSISGASISAEAFTDEIKSVLDCL